MSPLPLVTASVAAVAPVVECSMAAVGPVALLSVASADNVPDAAAHVQRLEDAVNAALRRAHSRRQPSQDEAIRCAGQAITLLKDHDLRVSSPSASQPPLAPLLASIDARMAVLQSHTPGSLSDPSALSSHSQWTWPTSQGVQPIPGDVRAAAGATHARIVAALGPSRRWCDVASTSLMDAADIRMQHAQWPWMEDAKGAEFPSDGKPSKCDACPSEYLPRALPSIGSPSENVRAIQEAAAAVGAGRIEGADNSDWWIAYACMPPLVPRPLDSTAARAPEVQSVRMPLTFEAAVAANGVPDPWIPGDSDIPLRGGSTTTRDAVRAALAAVDSAAASDVSAAGGVEIPVDASAAAALLSAPAFAHPLQDIPSVDEPVRPARLHSLAPPLESITGRVMTTRAAMGRRAMDAPSWSLTWPEPEMNVAARRVQKWWSRTLATREAIATRRARAQSRRGATLTRLAVVQDAMTHFSRLMEHVAGLESHADAPATVEAVRSSLSTMNRRIMASATSVVRAAGATAPGPARTASRDGIAVGTGRNAAALRASQQQQQREGGSTMLAPTLSMGMTGVSAGGTSSGPRTMTDSMSGVPGFSAAAALTDPRMREVRRY